MDQPSPDAGPSRRDVTKVLLTILAYGCVTIGAGHGIAPAGILLPVVLADGLDVEPGSISPKVFAWLGLLGAAAMLLHLVPEVGRSKLAAVAGVTLLGLSIITLLPFTEVAPLTLLTAIPFGYMAFRLLLPPPLPA